MRILRLPLSLPLLLPWSLLWASGAAAETTPEMIDGPLASGAVELSVTMPGESGPTRVMTSWAALELPAGAVIRIAGTPGFVPAPLPGFGAFYGSVRPVIVNSRGQQTLESGPAEIEADDWVGVRSRYLAVAVAGASVGGAEVAIETENQPVITIGPTSAPATLRAYSGPIEQRALRTVDPVLTKMLFAALWDPLRWLCFGMLWLLTAIDGLIGNIGWSIVLLSLAVKILMLPLTKYADSLQASVNRTQALLQPKIDKIKKDYKGEEAHERTLAVFKEHDVSPMYPFKSLVGFLIQIPIFIAAFDMLGENIALDGQSFLWIDDLARPDQWIALPLTLPFFGGYLNLLPVLMTGITLLTSWKQTDPHLTPELERAQTKRLYLMAGAFFLLFYTFPAGMVLYWTMNNLLHVLVSHWPLGRKTA